MLFEGAGGRRKRDEDREFAVDSSLDEQLLEASQEDYLCVSGSRHEITRANCAQIVSGPAHTHGAPPRRPHR